MRRFRAATMVIVAVSLCACTRWQPTTLSPRLLIELEQPESVRLLRLDGGTLVARAPMVRNDSIVGRVRACRNDVVSGRMCTIAMAPLMPLTHVQAVEVPIPGTHPSVKGALLLGAIGTAAGVVYMYAAHPECSSQSSELSTSACVGFALLLGGAPGALLGALAGLTRD